MFRKFFTIAIKTFIVLLILAGLLQLLLTTPKIQEVIKNYLIYEISRSSGVQLTIQKLEGSIFTNFVLKEIYLTYQQKPILYCRKLRLDYSPLALLFRSLHINELVIENLQGSISPQLLSPKKSSSPVSGLFIQTIFLEKVILKSSNLKFSTSSQVQPLQLKDLYLQSKIYLNLKNKNYQIYLEDFKGNLLPYYIRFQKITSHINYLPDKLEIPYLKIKLPQSSINLTVSIKNFTSPYLKLAVDADLNFSDLPFWQQSLPTVHPWQIKLKAAGLIPKLELETDLVYQQNKLQAQGNLDLSQLKNPRYSLSGRFSNLNLADFYQKNTLTSNFNGEFNLEGQGAALDNFYSQLLLKLEDSAFAGQKIYPSLLKFSFAPYILSLTESYLNTSLGKIQAQSQIYLPYEHKPPKQHSQLICQFQDLNLQSFFKKSFYSSKLQGKLKIETEDITKTNPDNIKAALNLTLVSSQIAGLKITKAEFKSTIRKRKINLSLCELDSDLLKLQTNGSLAIKGRLQVEYQFSIKDLSWLKNFIETKLPLSGMVQAKGQITETLTNPHLELNLEGQNLAIGEISLAKLQSKIDYLENNLQFLLEIILANKQTISLEGKVAKVQDQYFINLAKLTFASENNKWQNPQEILVIYQPDKINFSQCRLQNVNQIIELKGLLSTAEKEPEDLQLSLSQIDLTEFAQFLPVYRSLQGKISGLLKLSGNASYPEIKATLSLTAINFNDLLFDSLYLDLVYVRQKLTIKSWLEAKQTKLISLQAETPLIFTLTKIDKSFLEQNLDLNLQAESVSLEFLKMLLPQIIEKATGQLQLKINLFGKLTTPQIKGTLRLEKGQLRIKNTSQDLTDIELNANIDNERLMIKTLQAKSPTGEIVVKGNILLKNLQPEIYYLSLEASNFTVEYPDLFNCIIDSQLQLKGPKIKPDLNGKILVKSGKIIIPEEKSERLSDIQIVSALETNSIVKPSPSKTPSLFYDRLRIDISIETKGNILVQGKDFQAKVSGQIGLKKEPANLLYYTGNISSKEGYYDFQQHRFLVTKGDLQLTGAPTFNPALNIDAEYNEFKDIKIFVFVRGNLNNPIIQLKSEPPAAEVEILSFLLFGKSTKGLTEKEVALVEGQVINILGGAAALKVKDILGKRFAFDTLNIQRGEKIQDWRISIGKYVAKNLFVLYSFGFGPQAEDKLRLEYRLNKYLNVESELGQKESNGADLFWKLEY